MISIIEFVNRNLVVPNRGYVRGKVGKIDIRKASASKSIPSTPSKSSMVGINIDQMRKNKNVSSEFGTRFVSTAYKFMGRKAPPGTGFANVPLRRR
jgi:hypothetical protein